MNCQTFLRRSSASLRQAVIAPLDAGMTLVARDEHDGMRVAVSEHTLIGNLPAIVDERHIRHSQIRTRNNQSIQGNPKTSVVKWNPIKIGLKNGVLLLFLRPSALELRSLTLAIFLTMM